MDSSLLITEIYRSIQGESTHAGRPCGFVRLTGCPLRCRWCDTAYAFAGGERMSIDEIAQAVERLGVGLVEVTGGEPLAQAGCIELLERLCAAGLEVLLETSGAVDVGPVDRRVIKIVDVKCPGSGEADANRWENLDRLGPRDELKFVIAGQEDYVWARDLVRARGLAGRCAAVLFSPVHGELEPAALAEWIEADRLDVRLQVQLHKYLWPAATRGV